MWAKLLNDLSDDNFQMAFAQQAPIKQYKLLSVMS
jgi:hypothetical protein